MVSLQDVASKLGISVSAVSMALNDHPSISAGTKEKVAEACRALGWKGFAEQKRGRPRKAHPGHLKTGNVAFLLVERDFDDPAYSGIFHGVATAARDSQLTPISFVVQSGDLTEGRLPGGLHQSKLDGLIISGCYDGIVAEWASKLSIPAIVIGTYFRTAGIAACEIDVAHGMELMTAHLRSLGHQKIGLVLEQPQLYVYRLIREAFVRDHLENESAPADVLLHTFPAMATQGEMEALLARWMRLPERPTSIILPTERLVRPLYEAARQIGISIPHDLSVVSFGHTTRSSHDDASLTFAYADTRQIGRGAVGKLLQMIQAPKSAPTREIFPMYLQSGASSAPPPSLERHQVSPKTI